MIVVFGTVCLDRIRHVPIVPASGAYVEVDSEVVALGGEAANTASHLVRWGATVELIGNSIAADLHGGLLETHLADHGLSYPIRQVHTEATPVCDVYVTPDGERTMFGVGFRSMVVPSVTTFLPQAGRWFTTDGNFGAIAEEYAAKAMEGGMRLYLMDVTPESNLLAPGVIWHSSTRWVGERGKGASNSPLVQGLVDKTGCTAILSDSGSGMLVASPESPVKLLPGFPRPIVRDSTGAGDSLRAGVLLGLDRDWSFGRSLAFGSAAAALAAEFVGAAEGPTFTAVEAHLAAHPNVASQYA